MCVANILCYGETEKFLMKVNVYAKEGLHLESSFLNMNVGRNTDNVTVLHP